MGQVISDVLKKVGKDGVVTVEESFTLGINIETVEGMQIDRGYISPIMTTIPETMEAEYTDVPILVSDKKFTLLPDIKLFLDQLIEQGINQLVIICTDLDGDALKTLLFNKLRGGFSILAVRAPGYGEEKLEILHDIAVTVGAQVVSESTGVSLTDKDILGKAHRVTSSKDKTLIVGGDGKKELIRSRIEHLRRQIESIDVKLSKEKLTERLGKLAGGAAIIKVGAATEGDMTYLIDKLEDAINATKAAIAEGIVPGGGSVLVHIANILKRKFAQKAWWPTRLNAEQIGYLIVIEALSEPLRQIVENAGKDPAPILNRMMKYTATGLSGYDAKNNQFIDDMYQAGIIDPVKVTRTAVQYAVNSSSIALTPEVVIGTEPATS
jgi:chaperonin GroEL